jgi:hypothetical protein
MRTAQHLHTVLAGMLTVVLIGCSSLNLPSTEESKKKIADLMPQVNTQNMLINRMTTNLPSGSDITARIRLAAFNTILSAFTKSRMDDITINFPPTKPFYSEQKSILGINYTNQLDVNSGQVVMDIKSFTFDKFDQNKIDATLEIQGKGNISVSGKYTGIPASVSPEIELYLKESISFDVLPADTGAIILRPQSKTLILKTKFYVKLLEWKVPWSQDIPLQLTDLMKPVTVRFALMSEIWFPLPASKAGANKLDYVPYYLQLSKTSVGIKNGMLESKTDVDFKKK